MIATVTTVGLWMLGAVVLLPAVDLAVSHVRDRKARR